jgi:hypothetical protein
MFQRNSAQNLDAGRLRQRNERLLHRRVRKRQATAALGGRCLQVSHANELAGGEERPERTFKRSPGYEFVVEAQPLGFAATPRQEKLASDSIAKPCLAFDNENAMTASRHDNSQRRPGKATTRDDEIIVCLGASHDIAPRSPFRSGATADAEEWPRRQAKAMVTRRSVATGSRDLAQVDSWLDTAMSRWVIGGRIITPA